jgi:hypothetical protein
MSRILAMFVWENEGAAVIVGLTAAWVVNDARVRL